MQRRNFLKIALGLGAQLPVGAFSQTFFSAAPENRMRGKLLVVFLRGAYDATSALIPVASDHYYRVRPNIAVARPDPDNPHSAHPLTPDWGLHPNIANHLKPLLDRGELGFIPFIGVPHASRSHFEVQNLIELCGDGIRNPRQNGLLYRLAMLLGTDNAISFTEGLPAVFRGPQSIPNLQLGNKRKTLLSDEEIEEVSRQYENHPLHKQIEQAVLLRELQRKELQNEMQAASRGAPGVTQFRQQAARIAHHMRSRYPLAFVEIGGWDTHINQGSNPQGKQNSLSNQFNQLAAGLAEFSLAMEGDWQETAVIVLSEFGRTFAENGNFGTDHGHGSTYWVLGPPVAGMPVRGPRLALDAKSLNEGRDYPVLIDYRHLFAEVAGRLFGLKQSALKDAFALTSFRALLDT